MSGNKISEIDDDKPGVLHREDTIDQEKQNQLALGLGLGLRA
jgi:hypothetical protein